MSPFLVWITSMTSMTSMWSETSATSMTIVSPFLDEQDHGSDKKNTRTPTGTWSTNMNSLTTTTWMLDDGVSSASAVRHFSPRHAVVRRITCPSLLLFAKPSHTTSYHFPGYRPALSWCKGREQEEIAIPRT